MAATVHILLSCLLLICVQADTVVLKLDDKLGYEFLNFISKIRYDGPGELVVSKPWLGWGKWVRFEGGRVDKPVEIPAPAGKSVKRGEVLGINACGRANSPSGTEGSFDLNFNGDRAVYVYFTVPFAGQMKVVVRNLDTQRFKVRYYVLGESKASLDLNVTHIAPTVAMA